MNKRLFKSTALYTVIVVVVIIALAVVGVVWQAKTPATKTLSTQSASSLHVDTAKPTGEASVAPGAPDGISGSASSSGATTLQPSSPTPPAIDGGTVTYPCNSCPEAATTTDVMVCSDYCVSPEPTPTPTPYPGCNPCRGNDYGESNKMIMCPMIACRYME